MSWILGSIFDVLLGVLKMAFKTLAGNFIALFGINIGANFPTMASPSSPTLAQTLASYSGDTSQTAGANATDLFDAIFPVAAFKTTMIIVAIAILIILTVLSLIKAGAGVQGADHPITVLGRFVVSMIGIMFSYRLFIIFEYFFNTIYIEFQKVAMSAAVMNPSGINKAAATKALADNTAAVNSAIESATTSFFDPSKVSGYMDVTNQGVAAVDKTAGTLFFTLICIICLGAIIINFFKLLLEMVERYVLLGVLFYTAPLPFIGLGSKETTQVFSSWVRMVFSQFMLMILNAFFLNSFFGAMFTFGNLGINNMKKMNMTSYLVYMFALVAWLTIGQKVDQHMRALGLSTAQAGGNLGRALGGAIGTAYGLSKLAASGNKALRNASGGKFGKGNPAERMSKANKAFGQTAGGQAFGSSKVERGEGAYKKAMDNLKKQNPALAKSLSGNEHAINKAATSIGRGEQSLKFNNGGMMRTLDQDNFNKLAKSDKANFTANGDGTYSGFFAGSGDNSPILAARSAAGAKALNREMQGIYDKYSDDTKSAMTTSFGDSVSTLYGGGKDLNEIIMGSSAASVTPAHDIFAGRYTGDGNNMLNGFSTANYDSGKDALGHYTTGEAIFGLKRGDDITGSFDGYDKIVVPNTEDEMCNADGSHGVMPVYADGKTMYAVQVASLDPRVIAENENWVADAQKGVVNGADAILIDGRAMIELEGAGAFENSLANGNITPDQANAIYFKPKPLPRQKDAFEEFSAM